MLIMGLTRNSEANGPGKRGVIHFQGCSLGCPGCFNPQSHPFHERNRKSIGDIQAWIKSLDTEEGVTFSGGEPMQQAPYLYALLAWMRSPDGRPDLTIGMYTGYSKKELENGTFKWMSAAPESKADGFQKGSKQLWDAIKQHLDFAITGRYVKSMACNEPLRSSLNQEVLFFTERYSQGDLPPLITEITINDDALVQLTGFPTSEFLSEFEDPGIRQPSARPKVSVPVANDKDAGGGDDLVAA